MLLVLFYDSCHNFILLIRFLFLLIYFVLKGKPMTTFLAVLPILWLIVALAILKMPAWKATTIAAIGSFIIAVVPGLPFVKDPTIILSGALEGVALAVWPICLVITAAIFVYNLVVKTGAMETIKAMLSSVTEDKRILAILLAWGFGHFMEGMAGFGTAVAIPAAMMVAVGFDPLKSINNNISDTHWHRSNRVGYLHFYTIVPLERIGSILRCNNSLQRCESYQRRIPSNTLGWFVLGDSRALHQLVRWS